MIDIITGIDFTSRKIWQTFLPLVQGLTAVLSPMWLLRDSTFGENSGISVYKYTAYIQYFFHLHRFYQHLVHSQDSFFN
jgi:hypothetical protein